MRVLAIDSSGLTATVAIVEDDQTIAEYTTNYKKTHSQTLLPMIDEMVRMVDADLADIDAIAVAGGPGSFTGVRVGLAAARGIGLALGIPMHGVTTFEMAAYHLKRPLTVVLDTKRGDFYTQFFPSGRKKPESPCIQTAEEVKALAGYWTGNGVSLLGEDSRFIQNHVIPAEAVGLIARSRLDHPLAVEPVYLREADVTV